MTKTVLEHRTNRLNHAVRLSVNTVASNSRLAGTDECFETSPKFIQ